MSYRGWRWGDDKRAQHRREISKPKDYGSAKAVKIKSHSESHILELDNGLRWQIFPTDLDLTLNWKPDTELTIVPSDDDVSSHMLMGGGAKVDVTSAGRLRE